MYGIDLAPLFPDINEALKVLLAGGVMCIMGYVTWILHTKAPKFIDAQTQAKLAAVIDQGLNMAAQYALKTIEDHEKDLKPTTDSKIVQIGADYAIRHIGVTLGDAGKTPQDIAEMILARLPTAPTVVDTTGATVTKAIVTTETLAPIQETKP